MTHSLYKVLWASNSFCLWPLLCHTDPNNIATAMDQQQSAAFFPQQIASPHRHLFCVWNIRQTSARAARD